jgi:hypothetical protein
LVWVEIGGFFRMKKNELLKQGNYLTVIKPLAHKIGLEETIAIMELMGMEEYKEQKHIIYKEMMEEQNRKINQNKICFYENDRSFECTATEFELSTTFTRKVQDRVLDSLSNLNLIEKSQRGIPSKRFIRLNHENIEVVFEEAINGYKTFKDEFFNTKKKQLKEKKIKEKERKQLKETKINQGVQNGHPDKINISSEQSSEKPCSNQGVQNGHPREDKMDNQGCPKETPLNNIYSLIIPISKNTKDQDLNQLSDYINSMKLPFSLKKYFSKSVKVLVEDSFNILEVEDFYNTSLNIKSDSSKDDINYLNDHEFTRLVIKAYENANRPIGSTFGLIKSWTLQALSYKKENTLEEFLPLTSENTLDFNDDFITKRIFKIIEA